jgi:N-hydroxyarylamine O-acetyltransferase
MRELGKHLRVNILAMTIDMERYLARIGWRGELRADAGTLAGLLHAHMTSIPFENLDVLLGRPVRLDLDALQDKLVEARRGGYCYEHSTLFAAVLERVGFAVHTHSARVIMMTPKASAPRTHMLLSVDLPDGRVVVDPGFGGLAPLVPLPLDGTHKTHGYDEHWLSRDGDDYVLNARTPERVVAAWVTTLADDYPIDFVMANHYTSTHPHSPFTSRLMMRAFTGGEAGRVSVMNRDVTHWRDNVPTTSQLADRAALRELLSSAFGFELDVGALRVSSVPEWA